MLFPGIADLFLIAAVVDGVGAAAVELNLGALAGELVDVDLVELAGRDLVLEEDVEFGIGAVLAFGQHEVHEDGEQSGEPCVEEARHTSPIPVGGRKHARDHDVVEDTALCETAELVDERGFFLHRDGTGPAYQVIDVASQHHRLDLESGRGDFGDDRIADGADGEVVEERVHQQQGPECPRGAFVLSRDDTQPANEHEETEQDA